MTASQPSEEDNPFIIHKTYEEILCELIVKKCAYLVNHQQRTTGYTTHVQMLCREFGIEFKEEDYYGDRE